VPAGHFDATFRPVANVWTGGTRDAGTAHNTIIGFRPALLNKYKYYIYMNKITMFVYKCV